MGGVELESESVRSVRAHREELSGGARRDRARTSGESQGTGGPPLDEFTGHGLVQGSYT
jgi:hypothetical protein